MYVVPIGLMFLLDRITKIAVLEASGGVPGKIAEVFPFFNIVMVWNTGVSFNFLSNHGELGRWFLIAATSIIALLLARPMLRAKSKWTGMAYAMVIAGAIGNIWDRFFYGAVADFLDFHLMGWHFPAFNVADSLICMGIFLLLVRKD